MCRKFVVGEIQTFKQGDTAEPSTTRFNSGIKERLLQVLIIFFSALQGSHSLDQRFLSNLINSDFGKPFGQVINHN
jgi:hypothetical protein